VVELPGIDLSRSALLTRLARLQIAREKVRSNGDGAGSRNKSEHGRLLSLYHEYLEGKAGKDDPLSFAEWRARAGSTVMCPKCGCVNAGPYKVCPACVSKARGEDRAFEAALVGKDRETDL
jgi:rubrerythrin